MRRILQRPYIDSSPGLSPMHLLCGLSWVMLKGLLTWDQSLPCSRSGQSAGLWPAAKMINAYSWSELLNLMIPLHCQWGLTWGPGLATCPPLGCWLRECLLSSPLRLHALLLSSLKSLVSVNGNYFSFNITFSLLAQAFSHVAISIWNTYSLLPHLCSFTSVIDSYLPPIL